MSARDLLYDPDGRVRGPWRILLFIALTIAAGVFVYPLVNAAIPGESAPGMLDPRAMYVAGITGCTTMLAGHVICLRMFEQRGWEMVALDRRAATPWRLGAGFVLGVVAIGAPACVLLAVGWLRTEEALPAVWWWTPALTLVMLAPYALFEELLARGYVFAVIRERLGWPVALGLTSSAFGILHVSNEGAAMLPIILVTLAGILLGLVLLALRSLWAAWMTHLAWNWTLAGLLRSDVSGIDMPVTNYRIVDAGPDWATGGAWGPEGGVLAGAGMLAGIGFLYALVKRREERERNE